MPDEQGSMRELLTRADSYLSLLWHRPSTERDLELRMAVERTISDLRKASTHRPSPEAVPPPVGPMGTPVPAYVQQAIEEAVARGKRDAGTVPPPVEQDKGACPSCGCEALDHRGLWACRCPDVPSPSPALAGRPVEVTRSGANNKHGNQQTDVLPGDIRDASAERVGARVGGVHAGSDSVAMGNGRTDDLTALAGRAQIEKLIKQWRKAADELRRAMDRLR